MQWIRFFLLALVLIPGTAWAQSLNIDFGDVAGPSPLGPGFGAASGQTGEWNTITAVGSTPNLVGLGAAATGVSLTLGPAIVNPDGASGLLTGDLNLLMADFFFESSQADLWNVTLTGVDSGVYDVYVYAPANISSLQGTGTFTINGIAMSDIPGTGIQNFIQGVNYEILSDLTVTDGTITFASTEASTRFLGLAGVQLVQVPEPVPVMTPWGLVVLASALALAGSLTHRYRREILHN
jgi:hypothetical protein